MRRPADRRCLSLQAQAQDEVPETQGRQQNKPEPGTALASRPILGTRVILIDGLGQAGLAQHPN